MNCPKPMRLLMTADTVGGVWTYALELATAFSAYDVEVVLATMGAPCSSEQLKKAGALSNLTLCESTYKLEWMPDAWGDVAEAGDWLLELEEEFEPDVIHLNGYAHAALNWEAPTVVVAHSCVLSWWQAVHGCDAPVEWAQYRQAVTAGLRAADLVVAPSRAMLTQVERIYGAAAPAQVISNGRQAPRRSPCQKEPLILSAGRLWDAAKNIAQLNAVAAKLSWPVYIAGESEQPGDGGKKQNHCTADVNCLGFLTEPELQEWYERAAVYALPARYEPFGLSVLEAALAGCALVLGDIPSLREIWGDAALFVSPEDPEELREALQELTTSCAVRVDLSRRAQAVAASYTPERMARDYWSAYSRLAGIAMESAEDGKSPSGLDEKNRKAEVQALAAGVGT